MPQIDSFPLPPELADIVASYLTATDVNSVAVTSKAQLSLFRFEVQQKMTERLLQAAYMSEEAFLLRVLRERIILKLIVSIEII